MSVPTKHKELVLAKKAVEQVNVDETFKLVENDLPTLQDGQLLVKVLYLSSDPAQRAWIQEGIDPERTYVPPVKIGERMRSLALAEVLESKSDKVTKGTKVTGVIGWTDYAVVDAKTVLPIQQIPGLSETHYLGALGTTGLTAFYGLELVRTSKDDVVVVSGAAGATGSMAVQIAKKIIGAKKVIGIAGSEEKCKWVESLGADKCLNYKSSSFGKDLKEATGKQTDVYFDNVGGEILDRNMGCMAKFGRIAACGAISGYNNRNHPYGVKSWFEIIQMRLEIRGFIVIDAMSRSREIIGQLVGAYQEGKLKIDDESESVVPSSLEKHPEVWLKLFSGANQGKLVTKLEH